MPEHGLAGRHVVVTGATGALGSAVVEAFASTGAVCHLPVRGDPERNAHSRAVGAPHVHRVGGIDLADEASVARFYAGLPDLWASVHVAGGFAATPFPATSLADLERQLDINLVTAFLCCREAVRRMQGHGGRIVNVGSRAVDDPKPGQVAYAVSKAAVAMLTRAVAVEARAAGILVNAVLPSVIDTPANREAMPGADRAGWSRPADIAAAVVWLASPDNRLTTGTLLPV